MLSIFLKICVTIIFIFFINKYNLVDKIDDIIKGKVSPKEQFNNLLLPKEDPIKIMIEDQLPIYNLGLVNKGNYLDEMTKYFRRNIFPVNGINTMGTLDNIFRLIETNDQTTENRLDMAFVDEEILINFMNNHKHIRSNFDNKLVNGNLPTINFSVIAVCFHQSFIFMTGENSGILSYEDIKPIKPKEKKVRVGVLNKYNTDYFHMLKLFYLTNINPLEDIELQLFDDYNSLGGALYSNEVDIIYITSNKKNQMIFEITKAMKCRFISPKIKPEHYMFLNDNEILNNYNEPPFAIINESMTKSFYSLENVYSKNTLIYVLDEFKSEFNELLKLTTNFIPSNNEKSHILSNQIKYYSINELSNINTIVNSRKKDEQDAKYKHIVFLPQLPRIRMRITSSFNDVTLINLNNNKEFYNTLKTSLDKRRLEFKNRNKLIKNMFHIIFDKTENLNTSYRNINSAMTLDTYSTRMLLVARNDLDTNYIKQITENFILNLNELKLNINDYLSFESIETNEDLESRLDNQNKYKNLDSTIKKESKVNKNLLNSYVDNAFDFKALVSVKDIPIHKATKSVYEKYGLIKSVEIDETDVKQLT
jgi:hypothetical protein